MRRRSGFSLASSPTLVGAVTTLITIVAVFLAYNANQGLPFVPVYRVAVEVPNASRLLPNNEVRIGGRRVGVIEAIEPVRDDEEISARVSLKLDAEAEPLPKDSRFRVRYRSAFGLKYLEVVRGEGSPAPEAYVFSDPDPLRSDPAPDTAEVVAQTEFDDINDTFDERTRDNLTTALTEFANAFAGRGASVNSAIVSAGPALRFLRPVARVLSAAPTRLDRFVDELADVSRILAPVADEQVALLANAATTFAAMSADPEALRDTISEGPATLETGIRVLPGQTQLLAKLAVLSEDLYPGAVALESALPTLNDAAEIGTPVLRRTPALGRELERSFRELERVVAQPSTGVSLMRLTDLFDSAKPLARWVVPAQTVCNYWNYFFTFVPGTIADEDQVGFTVRQRAMLAPFGPVAFGFGPLGITLPGQVESGVFQYAGVPAGGKAGPVPDPSRAGAFDPYHAPILHAPAYGPTGQRDADCQPGQLGYTQGQMLVPGQSPSSPAALVSDIPGSRGPTTVFFDENGDRVLRDSRVESRQP